MFGPGLVCIALVEPFSQRDIYVSEALWDKVVENGVLINQLTFFVSFLDALIFQIETTIAFTMTILEVNLGLNTLLQRHSAHCDTWVQ